MYGGFFSLKSLSRNVNIFIPLILFEICFREPIIFFAFPAFCLGGILKCAVDLCQRVGGTQKMAIFASVSSFSRFGRSISMHILHRGNV